MAKLTPFAERIALDAVFGGTGKKIAYSVNGTSVWAGLAATAVTFSAATTPGTGNTFVANTGELTSAAATAAGTPTHAQIHDSAGNALCEWEPITDPRPMVVGDQVRHGAGLVRAEAGALYVGVG